jgi:CheY-like chemotaxis protein
MERGLAHGPEWLPMTSHTPRHRSRILAIDNAVEILHLYEALLGEEGYTVIPIPCQAAGPAVLRQMQPDVVLLDCFIGSCCTGWDVLDMLRRDPHLNRIPVVICTTDVRLVGKEDKRLDREGIRRLGKPFDVYDLLSTVETAIASTSAADAVGGAPAPQGADRNPLSRDTT